MRIYELYGNGLGYSECWETYDDIDQSIFHYNIVKDTMPSEKGGFAYMDCSALRKYVQ